ncbi:MAG: GAF domain-containing protein [Planctomycetota bacterium]|nr:GAF domain-containing protein [Planctomycetota bacterium]MDI6787342.1 GAF domain-containing protein [Planctomycetota bacterium]
MLADNIESCLSFVKHQLITISPHICPPQADNLCAGYSTLLMEERDKDSELEKPQKHTPLWLLGVVGVIVYVVNLIVLVYFTFSRVGTDLNMLITLISGLATTTGLAGLLLYSMLSAYEKSRAINNIALKDKKLSADAQKYLKIVRSLLRVSALHSQQMEISRLLKTLVNEIKEGLDADRVSLMLLDKGDNRLYTRAVAGEYDEYQLEQIWKSSVSPKEGIAGYVMEKGEALLLDDNTDYSKFNGYVTKSELISSAMSAPLHLGTEIIGVININRLRDTNRNPFDNNDLMLLSIFAEDIAMVVENAYLTREMKKSKTLSDIGIDLGIREIEPSITQPVPRRTDKKKESSVFTLNITTQKLADDIMMLNIKGVLDSVIGEELKKTVQRLLEYGITRFIINLAGVKTIRSEGIGVFTSFISLLQKRNGRLVIAQPSAQVKTALNLFGLNQFFSITDDIPESVKILSS